MPKPWILHAIDVPIDLRGKAIVWFDRPWCQQDPRARERGPKVKAPGRSRLSLDSGEAIRDATIDGLGIALLPDFLVARELAAGRLQRVLRDWRTDGVRVLAVYPEKRLLEPRVRRFIDHLVAELGEDRQRLQ